MPTVKRQTRTMPQMFPPCIGFIAQGFISQLALYRANFLEVVPSCGTELKARNIDVWLPRWQRRFSLYLETKFCLRIMYHLELKSLAFWFIWYAFTGFLLWMREHCRCRIQIHFISYLHINLKWIMKWIMNEWILYARTWNLNAVLSKSNIEAYVMKNCG